MKHLLSILFLLLSFIGLAQRLEIQWKIESYSEDGVELNYLTFDEATFNWDGMPLYSSEFEMPLSGKAHVELMSPTYEPLTFEEIRHFKSEWKENLSKGQIRQSQTSADGVDYIVYHITPFRLNPEDGKLEKLVAFDVIPILDSHFLTSLKTGNWASQSVLQSGKWLKLAIEESGLYKVSVNDLQSNGLNILGASSTSVHFYHNPGGMLPEKVSDDRFDDLSEISVQIEDGGDGILHGSDWIYFYATGPHDISYNANDHQLEHHYNVYSDEAYVFVTLNSNSAGKRVESSAWNGGAATVVSLGFDELLFHEKDERNIAGTGREWFGEVFDFNLSKSLSFQFPNRIVTDPVIIRAKGAASSPISGTRLEFVENNTIHLVTTFSYVSGSIVYSGSSKSTEFYSPNTNVNLTVNYNRGNSTSSTAYLDYVSVQARRNWLYSQGGYIARDLESVSPGSVVSYTMPNANAWVWDVTNPVMPFLPERNSNGAWVAPGDSLRTYLVCSPADAKSVGSIRLISNQDLHGLTDVDMLIISHPDFLSSATDLAQFHQSFDNLTSVVVTPQEIYNEFSCGKQDITAIRDFVRMLKKRNAVPLQYVLMMGDASFDYKDRVPNHQNFVPIYESVNSNSLYSSFMTDDYFVCVDENEGVNLMDDKLDLNIGRLPVKTPAEAQAVVNKIINYKSNPDAFGDWRTRLVYVSDDVDEAWEAILTQEPENISRGIDTTYPAFNIEKIYSDSYTQVSTSGSQSYPGARHALYRSVQRGNLVTSYTGHGGEVGWSSERLLQLSDVNSWTNGYKLPLFITITCEFTRLDDPFRTSAGEQLMLNSNGGAVALISTTRVVFVPGAIALNRAVANQLFEIGSNGYKTLGEIVRTSKNSVNDGDKVRFSLIGDPALRLNIPEHTVVVDSINGHDALSGTDTIKARELVTLSGRVLNSGSTFNSFNGDLTLTVFDKAISRNTKLNDGAGTAISFKQQENVIYRGNVSVESGYWTTQFIVPRDINFSYGNAKISLYADNDATDAMGYNRDVTVGGLGNAPFADDLGPEIRLFMNDTLFVNGGRTDENPLGLALVSDSSGINVVGNGLGHDIIGILDHDDNSSFKLNSYYTADVNTYRSGVVKYPFFNLSNGLHTLKVRVWDVMNNYAEASITFVVANRDELVIGDLFNYPNPFTDVTRFSFEHNRQGEELEVELHIMDMSGRVVNFQSQTIMPEGNRTLDMTWDGTTGLGRKVSSGTYVFRLLVRSKADGSEVALSERLVFLR